MKRIAFLFVGVASVTGVTAWMIPSSLGPGKASAEEAKQIIVTTIPPGYRDWKFISAAHEADGLNDIRVVIGNDKAIEAYRAGKPFPEGTIIGRVAWPLFAAASELCVRVHNLYLFEQRESLAGPCRVVPITRQILNERSLPLNEGLFSFQSPTRRSICASFNNAGVALFRQRPEKVVA